MPRAPEYCHACWPPAGGSVTAVLLIRSPAAADISTSWASLGLPTGAEVAVRGIWNHVDLPVATAGKFVVRSAISRHRVAQTDSDLSAVSQLLRPVLALLVQLARVHAHVQATSFTYTKEHKKLHIWATGMIMLCLPPPLLSATVPAARP